MGDQPTNFQSFFANVPDPLQSFYAGQTAARAREASAQQQQFQAQQNQATLNAAQLKAQAIAAAIAKPSPDSYRAAALTDPDHAAGILGALGNLTEEQRRTEVGHAAAVDGYLQSEQYDKARASVQQKRDADANAGLDTSDDDALLDQIKNSPKAARAHSGIMMASLDPKTFAPTLNAYDASQKQGALLPGEVAQQPVEADLKAAQAAQARAQTDQILHPRDAFKSAGNDPLTGRPYVLNERTGDVTGGQPGGAATSNNGALDNVVTAIMGAENATGNPNAKNPASSATGNGQFVKGTWLDIFPKLHPELAAGKSEDQVLAYRASPQYSREATTAYAQQNAGKLEDAGLPVNAATLVMAHRLDAGPAQAVLNAARTAPDTPLKSILPPSYLAKNPELVKQTAGGYTQGLIDKFGASPIDSSPGDPNATGDEYLKTLPPQRARLIRSIAEGDAPMPTGRSATTGAGQALMEQVLQYDPTASALNLPARQATRKDYTSGKSAAQIKSLNTLAGHAEELDASIDGLRNTGIPLNNTVANWLGEHTGDAKIQKAVARFDGWVSPVSSELTTLLRNGGGNESDVQNWIKQLKHDKSPTSLHQTVQDIVRAAQSRLGALQDSYNQGMQTTDKPLPFLRPSTQQIFDRLSGMPAQGASAQAVAPAIAVDPQGKRHVYDAASGQWRPLS